MHVFQDVVVGVYDSQRPGCPLALPTCFIFELQLLSGT